MRWWRALRRRTRARVWRLNASSIPPCAASMGLIFFKCAESRALLSMAARYRSVPRFRATSAFTRVLAGNEAIATPMPETSTAIFAPGGYRYIPAVFQYSGGVVAQPGHEIVRVRFRRPAPLAAGFARIAEVIRTAGRPLTAFCACEL